MSSYKINKVYLENFKLVKTNILIEDLANNDLLVFDGPNGFGKTTVFDAIEIALTGEIFRIFGSKIVPRNQGATDSVFLNEQHRPLKIVIEFIKDNEKKVLFVYGKSGNSLNPSDKKADSKNYFKRFLLEDFDDYKTIDTPTNLTELTQNDINNWFKGVDLERYYKLYHYIQQAETTFFLKQKEDDRMKQLSILFDTRKEDDEKVIIQEYWNNVNNEYNNLKNQLEEKEKRVLLLERIKKDDDDNAVVAYKKTFENGTFSPEWDRELLIDIRATDSSGVSKRDLYKSEINKIIAFVSNFDERYNDYQNFNLNREIDLKISQKNLISDTILTFHFKDELNAIKSIYSKQNQRLKYSNSITKEVLTKNILTYNFKELLNEFGLDSQFDLVQNKIKQIESLKTKEGEFAEIFRDYENTRIKLLELFKKIIKSEPKINEKECPFCGYEWNEGYEELLKGIDSKKEKIKLLQNENDLTISSLIDEFYTTHISPIVKFNDEFLSDSKNRISEEFFNQINIDDSRLKNMLSFVEWLKEKEINFSLFIHNQYNIGVKELDEIIRKFIENILEKKKIVTEEFNYNGFSALFEEIFEKQVEKVKLISKENLTNKIKYIDQEYFKGNQVEKAELEKQINFIKTEQLPKLDTLKNKINEVYNCYESEIKQHRIEIAKNVEVPFFIYSSKILQNFEKGIGVFIQFSKSDRTENLKFTQGMETDHDVLHSMSSGQLSALVIAFTLAMNKIYDESNIGFLLIDDPVQTMDEINMSSLVELLRNDFSDKQIIVSTHEDDISAFIRFKFHNFGRKAIPINMKTKQFESIT